MHFIVLYLCGARISKSKKPRSELTDNYNDQLFNSICSSFSADNILLAIVHAAKWQVLITILVCVYVYTVQ